MHINHDSLESRELRQMETFKEKRANAQSTVSWAVVLCGEEEGDGFPAALYSAKIPQSLFFKRVLNI